MILIKREDFESCFIQLDNGCVYFCVYFRGKRVGKRKKGRKEGRKQKKRRKERMEVKDEKDISQIQRDL